MVGIRYFVQGDLVAGQRRIALRLVDGGLHDGMRQAMSLRASNF